MRPTRGVVAALLVAAVLHQLSGITGGGWLSLGAGAALALPVAAVLLRPRLEALVVVSDPVRTRVGSAVEVRLSVRNAGRRPSPPTRLHDATPGLSPVVIAVPALAPGASVEAVVVRHGVARGRWVTGRVELSSSAPFGMVRSARRLEVPGPFVVAPGAQTAPPLLSGGEGDGELSSREAGGGTEVLGLRAFRTGDSSAAVHARATARHGRPVVLERERDTGPSVVLLGAGPGSGPVWEAVVARGCALAEAAVRSGRPPRLLATGLTAPARPSAGAVLDWHAALDTAGRLDAPTLADATRSAARGGTVVLLAPDAERVAEVHRACAATGARLTVLGG